MARRHALTQALLDEQGLDALVIFGNSGVNRHNHANVYWLSQYLDMHHSYLVVPRHGDATLLVGLANHVPNAREESDVPNKIKLIPTTDPITELTISEKSTAFHPRNAPMPSCASAASAFIDMTSFAYAYAFAWSRSICV